MGKNNNRTIKKTNFFDVMIVAINKGQGLPYLFGLILICLIFTLPSPDLSRFVFTVFDSIVKMPLIGWLLFVATLTGWLIHARYQRSSRQEEIIRISRERDALQEKLLGALVQSSSKNKDKNRP